MRELVDTARQWTLQGRTGVLARPISEQGFGPRHPAGAILIDEDGNCHGTLYRGAFDTRLAAEAAALQDGHTARVCELSVHADEVRQARLTCGGQAQILLQPLHTVPARWWDLLGEGADVALVTRLDKERTRAVSTVVTPDRPADDPATSSADPAEHARHLLARHRAGRESRVTDAGLVLIETVPAVPHLVVVGGGELAELLVAQAQLLGWQATVTDAVGDARKLLADHSAACLVVLSHEPELDIPVLHTALTSGIPYVGALGSRHTQARRAAALAEAGLDEGQRSRIHGPIGLDLGARTPAETALAICAEILAALDQRQVGTLREGAGPING